MEMGISQNAGLWYLARRMSVTRASMQSGLSVERSSQSWKPRRQHGVLAGCDGIVENVQGVAHFFSVQEFAVHGRPSVSNVSFTTSGSPIPQRLECDGVIFTGGFTPNSELIRAAEVRFNSATHGPSINQSFQTSKPWLFAAGNCLRGVVSGDEAALEGRMAARAIAEFLQSDSKANAPETLLSVDEPLAYCCPDRISADHHGLKRIAIWPNVHARQAELAAWCGNRQLWSKHFRWVQPGRRIFIPVDQLTFSTPPEPIRFSLEL